MTKDEAKLIYKNLFSSEDKIKAFDEIAELYYMSNFGSKNKKDFETLLFSLYYDQIIDKSNGDWTKYSDYTLSKQLGITQQQVNTLKVRKELMYPKWRNSWKEEFLKFCDNAVFEDNKIKIFIPNIVVFQEIKNAIEQNGGYVEIQFTKNLLQLRLPYLLDLLVSISDDEDKCEIKNNIENTIKKNDIDIDFTKNITFGKCLMNQSDELIIMALDAITGNSIVTNIAKTVIEVYKKYKMQRVK